MHIDVAMRRCNCAHAIHGNPRSEYQRCRPNRPSFLPSFLFFFLPRTSNVSKACTKGKEKRKDSSPLLDSSRRNVSSNLEGKSAGREERGREELSRDSESRGVIQILSSRRADSGARVGRKRRKREKENGG